MMAGRGFCVRIELDLQAITCPGVWLCPNGKVALQLNTLNARVESRRVPPAFPLPFYDKFTFKKLFTGVSTLAELQSSLEDEYLYTELVQWSSPNSEAVILATFETNLADLLYPAPCFKGLLTGSEVDLLMEPTKYFPGILAPKIEVSTRTVIEEVIGVCDTTSGGHVINPNLVNSKNGSCVHRKRPSKGIIRQQKVCHTQGKKTQTSRPPRPRYTGTDGTSSSVSNSSNNHSQSQIAHCCRGSKGVPSSAYNGSVARNREISPLRNSSHMFDNCQICSKYRCYFSHNFEEQSKLLRNSCDKPHESLHKIYDAAKGSRYSCTERENDSRKCRPRSAPHHGSLRDGSTSSVLRAKSKQMTRKEGNANYVAGDTREIDYLDCERVKGTQGFYKNLEKFYKRMYKQAKIRAQEVDCA